MKPFDTKVNSKRKILSEYVHHKQMGINLGIGLTLVQ